MNNPFVSIIIPVRNESAYLERCLLAILQQNYPLGHMEILIADGMSTDDTRRIMVNFSARNPVLQIYVLDNPLGIVPTGMNIALQKAKGEVIIRVDGHCLIAADYVYKCVEHLQRGGVSGVGGSMESIGETEIAQAIAIGMSSPFGVGNSAFRTISGRSMLVDTVPFPAYLRKTIEDVGLYDEELIRNQDDEYNYRIRELGGKILLADDVHSRYFSRSSLKGLWRQYFQYGYWKVRVLQKHPRQMSLRQFVPPAFVLVLMISIILAVITSSFHPFAFSMPILYGIVNFSVSLCTCYRYGFKYFRWMPFIFIILHFSYGSGFLAGLIKFSDRWSDKNGKVPLWRIESHE